MAPLRQYTELQNVNDAYINNAFQNILTKGEIQFIRILRDEIMMVIETYPSSTQAPPWFENCLDKIVSAFLDLLRDPTETKNKNPRQWFDLLMFNYNAAGINFSAAFTIPFLQNYASTQKLLVAKETFEENYSQLREEISEITSESIKHVHDSLEDFEQKKVQIEESLSIINKEVGRIGVKKYAQIFEDQARTHSLLCKRSHNEDGPTEREWGFGDSQKWLLTGLGLICATIYLASNLNSYFPVNGTTYTPQVIVNITGRAVAISVAIFFISFAFKQYRISMHLHTMNIFRANTLKSFEYLTKAPDSLSPESYNAILMKVAESIYEAGQTGYIDSSEKHNDIPSIVEMTKIVNPVSKL